MFIGKSLIGECLVFETFVLILEAEGGNGGRGSRSREKKSRKDDLGRRDLSGLVYLSNMALRGHASERLESPFRV